MKVSEKSKKSSRVIVVGHERRKSVGQRSRRAIYSDFVDLGPVGFFTLDRRARITKLNEAGARLLGCSPASLGGRSLLPFIARYHVLRFLAELTEASKTLKQTSFDLDLVVDDRLVRVQAWLTGQNVEGQVFHELALVDDTDAKSTKSQLHESLAQWDSLVSSAPDVIVTLTKYGGIQFSNRPLWGYSISAIIGTRIFDYIDTRQRTVVRKSIEESIRGEGTQCEISRDDPRGIEWYLLSFSPAQELSDGSITLAIRDITEQKRLEERLRASGKQSRDLAAHVEAAREEERARLSRELHDELGQALTVMKLDLAWLERNLDGPQLEARTRMKALLDHVDDTIERVRQISSDLRPSILDNFGLLPALEWQLSEFQKRTGLQTRFVCKGKPFVVDHHISTTVFRVVQEALTNVVRHAQASRLLVTCDFSEKRLSVCVDDDGIGITQEQIGHFKSLGIIGMKERVARVGGELQIGPKQGKGTRLKVFIGAKHAVKSRKIAKRRSQSAG